MPLFRNAATLLGSSVVAVPLGLAGSLILARYLAVDARGTYALALSLSGMIFIVVQLGLPIAVIFEGRRRGSPPARLMTTHFAANLATGIAGALLCLWLPEPLREALLPGVEDHVLRLAALTVPALVIGEFLRAVARTLDRFDLHSAATVLQPLGLLIALLFALVLNDGGLEAALVSFLLVQVVLIVWLSASLLRQTGLERGIHWADVRRSLRYGLGAYAQSVLSFLQERIALFQVAYVLADSVALGVYAVAASAAAPFRIVPNSLSISVFPELAESSEENAARTTALVVRHAVAWTAVICALVLPTLPWLVPLLFGAAYAGAVPVVIWLLPGVCVLAATQMLARYFQAIDSQRTLIAARLLSVLANLAIGLILIPVSGIVGAAQASLVANATEAVFIGVAFCAATGLGPRAAFAPRRTDLDPYRMRLQGLVRRLRSRPSPR